MVAFDSTFTFLFNEPVRRFRNREWFHSSFYAINTYTTHKKETVTHVFNDSAQLNCASLQMWFLPQVQRGGMGGDSDSLHTPVPAQSSMRSSNSRGNILGKLRTKVPKSSMGSSNPWGGGGILGKYLPKVHQREVPFPGGILGLPRIEYSVWLWQQNLHTGPSSCITDYVCGD